jgi:hypothetical protein
MAPAPAASPTPNVEPEAHEPKPSSTTGRG